MTGRVPALACFEVRRALEDLLARYADRIPFAFCGHTHRAQDGIQAGIRGHNVGSDYPFIKPARVLEELDALSLKPEAKAKILRENAAKLLKLELA